MNLVIFIFFLKRKACRYPSLLPSPSSSLCERRDFTSILPRVATKFLIFVGLFPPFHTSTASWRCRRRCFSLSFFLLLSEKNFHELGNTRSPVIFIFFLHHHFSPFSSFSRDTFTPSPQSLSHPFLCPLIVTRLQGCFCAKV